MTTPFVLLTTQRSGSAMLVQSLSQHPQVICYHELFRHGSRERLAYDKFVAESVTRRLARIVAPPVVTKSFLQRVFDSPSAEDAVGFKLMYNHLRRHWELPRIFRLMNVRVIHLVRNNVLKTYVSSLAARQRRLYHAKAPADGLEPIVVPTAEIVRVLQRRASAIAAHRRKLRNHPCLEVSYEAMLGNRDSEMRRIFRFLNVDEEHHVSTDYIKINPDRLRDVIANYREVELELAGSPFVDLLQ